MKRPRSQALVAALCGALFVAGCHRGFYRRQADKEARALIEQKMCDPRWDSIDPSINIHHQSRMFDVFPADSPPMPQDDPTSHRLMEQVDCKPGYPHWHANGDTIFVASPEWLSYLPLNEDGELEIDLDTAVKLALIHSPEYQQARESLYQSALDVSLERFAFDAQGFASWNTFFRTQGRLAPGGSQSLLDLSTGTNRIGIEKLGITGTNFAVGLANSIVWNFSGPTTQSANTLLDFSLIQPLLRGAGRDVIMESLTQAERNLLADVRQMERFRRGFYLSIAVGGNAGAGPGSNALNSSPTGPIGGAGGYLGLLQTQQQIRIREFNVRSLQNAVDQFEEFFIEQQIDRLQVTQVISSLLNGQQQLQTTKINYQNQLDAFKRTLGLPPDLPVIINDPLIEQFNLVDEQTQERQLEAINLREQIGEALAQVPTPPRPAPGQPEQLLWSDELRRSLEALGPLLDRFSPVFQAATQEDIPTIQNDFKRLEAMRGERLQKLEKLREIITESEIGYEIDPSVLQADSMEDQAELTETLGDLLDEMDSIDQRYQQLRLQLADLIENGPNLDPAVLADRVKQEVVFEAPDILFEFYNQLVQLALLQALPRTDSITLPVVEISTEEAINTAYQFRRDLMNARAALVDEWRQIEFVADDLESTLDVVFDGSVGSTGDNPFKIHWDTNQFNMGIRFDSPITRQAERNRYRQQLIQYQQSRRRFYDYEDGIKEALRRTIRELELSQVLFELSRRGIKNSVESVEESQLRLLEPRQPGAGGGGRGNIDTNAARDVTSALDTLLNAQNDFLGVWVDYEAQRRGLDFNLGTMQMTPDGYWVDPGIIDETIGGRAAAAYGMTLEDFAVTTDNPPLSAAMLARQNGAVPDWIPEPLVGQARPRPDQLRPSGTPGKHRVLDTPRSRSRSIPRPARDARVAEADERATAWLPPIFPPNSVESAETTEIRVTRLPASKDEKIRR